MQDLLFLYIIIIFSAIIHEYAHGWAANSLGDPTAKYAGRLTLNPLVHIDTWGTVLMPLLLMSLFGIFIGYAKPVPINPYNLKNQKRDVALVGLAGPGTNFIVAIIMGLIVRFALLPSLNPLLSFVALINIWLGLFNLIPFPPLDGSKVLAGFLPFAWQKRIENISPLMGIFLAIFLATSILPWLAPWLIKIITGQNILLF